MRDAEHELSEDDTSVEITPLAAEDEPAEAQNFSTARVSHDDARLGRANRSGTRRFLLSALIVCLTIAFFLVTIVLPRTQSPQSPAHPSSIAASPMLSPNSTPSYVPTDYSVNTTIVNGVVYAGSANGAVYALRASDGKILWHHKIDPGANAAPLVSDGIIYITASISDVGPSTLYALRANDGVEIWHYTSSDSLSAPIVDEGIIYVIPYDEILQTGSLVALRASNGTQLWHQTTKGFSYNTPAVDNQVVYVSASADNGSAIVYALRAGDGSQLWHKTSTTFISVPLAVNGMAYLLSNQGLSAQRASDGQVLWSTPIEGNADLLPQVINGVLFLTTTKASLETSATPTSQVGMLPQAGMIDKLLQSVEPMVPVKQTLPLKQGISSVYAVRISDGAVLWHYSMSKENGNNWANWFSIENDTVYIGTYVDRVKSYIYALRSSDGSMIWRQAMQQGMLVNAYVVNGVIYIASFINNGSANDGSGAVYALRASDGSQLWDHSMYWVVYNPPVLVGSMLYVSTAAGDVFAFQASNGSLLWHFHTNVQ